jgi:hypothetical protein
LTGHSLICPRWQTKAVRRVLKILLCLVVFHQGQAAAIVVAIHFSHVHIGCEGTSCAPFDRAPYRRSIVYHSFR